MTLDGEGSVSDDAVGGGGGGGADSCCWSCGPAVKDGW